uniref:Uncharacterized protein n=1 Tax=Aegilops tauschii TaxID=37682 RepID=N1QUS9_AEGTA
MAVILVVMGVVAMLQTQQAQASHCCCVPVLMTAYLTCRPFGSTSTCCHYCTGYMSDVDSDDCRMPYERAPAFVQADYPKTAVDYCKLGCTTSECNKLTQSGKINYGSFYTASEQYGPSVAANSMVQIRCNTLMSRVLYQTPRGIFGRKNISN